ncbi:MAG TPA: acetyl-CoA carboxylase biotin carboxyl carrier protein [Bryobacterales bacterium]|jgi:acetyl-CoA carboxylase biotin carboxyl carrier protein|nr:acetyl-CoA carboxylase biotin carboxyl carrier protein [Bryobacterales bacterium]
MNLKEIKELIDALTERDIAEFELERGNEKIRIKRATAANGAPQIAFAHVTPALPVGPGAPAALAAPAAGTMEAPPARPPEEELHIVKSPIVGTFYEASSPGSPPFVQVGDSVEAGQVLCIIEAMKLMNEIESDVAGVVEKRFVSNQQPVEYGEALFGIRKKG